MKIPSSSRKRYLSGADWCVTALSKGTADLTGRRCIFQIAVFLDAIPDSDRLKASFREFCDRFPVLWGGPARCWCLAPYWRTPSGPNPYLPIRIGHSSLPENATWQTVLRQIEILTNRHAARLHWTVAFDTIHIGNTHSVLVFSFDHKLFDAAGGESFINLFLRYANDRVDDAEFPPPHLTASAQLDHWATKFKSGQKVNRLMRSLARGDTCSLPLPRDVHYRPFRFRVERFNPAEAERIRERAFTTAGYLMLTPYLLATAAAVFRDTFRAATPDSGNFVVSVSTAKSQQGAPRRRLFFNNLSFLYFQFPVDEALDRDALAVTLREQLIHQGREQIPAAIEDANLLMRILPLRSYWRLLMRFYRNHLSSFGFTSLGESAITEPTVLGCPVSHRIHFPVIPTPPGIGLIVDQSGGGYHIVLSYIEGIITEENADTIMANLRAHLL